MELKKLSQGDVLRGLVARIKLHLLISSECKEESTTRIELAFFDCLGRRSFIYRTRQEAIGVSDLLTISLL